jgi:HPt (histidine-containing phosphotransfer) domain-containing protein
MNNQYTFSTGFNQQFLDELYAGDLDQISMIFEMSLDNIKTELPLAAGYFANNDPMALKGHYHKMKPVFGYVGLTDVQQLIQTFEHKCMVAKDVAELEADHSHVKSAIEAGVVKLENEMNRLTAHLSA